MTLGELGIERMIILKYIFKGKGMRCGVDSLDSRYGMLASYAQHDNEPSGFINVENFMTGCADESHYFSPHIHIFGSYFYCFAVFRNVTQMLNEDVVCLNTTIHHVHFQFNFILFLNLSVSV
jgi:hypothetical protein